MQLSAFLALFYSVSKWVLIAVYQSWGKPEAAIQLFTDISLAESPYAKNINEALGIIIFFIF